MGLNTYAILYPPFVSIVLSSSVWGLRVQNKPEEDWKFGTVDAVNYFGERTQIGQPVIFDANKAVLITQSTNSFFIVDENNLLFQEKPIP